jgi:hypothetical protein
MPERHFGHLAELSQHFHVERLVMSNNPSVSDIPPLFVNEQECAARLGIAITSWPTIRRKWEARGFPKPHIEVGKHFWPAVSAWVRADNGASNDSREAELAKENWDE